MQPVLDERRAAEAAKLRLLGEAERALALERTRLTALEADRRRLGAFLTGESAQVASVEVRRVLN